jgi:hypothetical protein
MAEAAGYRVTRSYNEIEQFATDFPALASETGPVLIVLEVEADVADAPVEQTWESNARMPAAFRSVRASLAPGESGK